MQTNDNEEEKKAKVLTAFRIEESVLERVDALARNTGKKRSAIINEAISGYLEN